MTDFCEKIDKLYVTLTLELNGIETNRFFMQKDRVNKIQLGSENVKNGVQ